MNECKRAIDRLKDDIQARRDATAAGEDAEASKKDKSGKDGMFLLVHCVLFPGHDVMPQKSVESWNNSIYVIFSAPIDAFMGVWECKRAIDRL